MQLFEAVKETFAGWTVTSKGFAKLNLLMLCDT